MDRHGFPVNGRHYRGLNVYVCDTRAGQRSQHTGKALKIHPPPIRKSHEHRKPLNVHGDRSRQHPRHPRHRRCKRSEDEGGSHRNSEGSFDGRQLEGYCPRLQRSLRHIPEEKIVDWSVFLSIQGRPVDKDTLSLKLVQLCPSWAEIGGPSNHRWELFFKRYLGIARDPHLRNRV